MAESPHPPEDAGRVEAKMATGACFGYRKQTRTVLITPGCQAKGYQMKAGSAKGAAKSAKGSKPMPLNRYTGKPRKWKYSSWRTSVDSLFEFAEAESATPATGGLRGLPRTMLEEMFRYLYHRLNCYALALGIPEGQVIPDARLALSQDELQYTALTKAEFDYCYNEGIDPGQFIYRKREQRLQDILNRSRPA